MVTFSGCMVEDEGAIANAGATPDSSADASTPANATAANLSAAPVLVITLFAADVEIPIANGTYAAPAGANITFDSSGSADPEGKNLSFAWDFADGNTSTDASPVHAFEAPGTFNVTVIVSDEDNVNSSATLGIVVTPSGPVSGSFVKLEKKSFKSTISGVALCAAYYGEGTDVRTFYWDFTPAEADGTATLVNLVVLKMTSTGGTGEEDIDLFFYDPAGKELGKSTGATTTETITIEKDLVAGKYKIVARACIAAQTAFEIKGEATYVVA